MPMFFAATDRAIRPTLEHGAIVSDDDCERMVYAQAASASSELLQDDEAERRMTLAGYFWTAYLALLLVAVGAGIAHFLPALKALVNN